MRVSSEAKRALLVKRRHGARSCPRAHNCPGVAAGKRPASLKEDEAAVYDFCIQLHRTKKVDDANFKRVKTLFGEQGVIDLIGVSGYYSLVSMTLNVAEVPVPDGKPLPLKPLD